MPCVFSASCMPERRKSPTVRICKASVHAFVPIDVRRLNACRTCCSVSLLYMCIFRYTHIPPPPCGWVASLVRVGQGLAKDIGTYIYIYIYNIVRACVHVSMYVRTCAVGGSVGG